MEKIINKYIKRIKSDYPEDDKLHITLKSFLSEANDKSTVVRSLDEVKEDVANDYDKTWEQIMKDYEYGMGISALMGFEELMDIVAERYRNQ